ncbi:MAG TPA: hypothetical protein VF755_25265 [Catenuloplanes sp.]|jgi:hypothetical protein
MGEVRPRWAKLPPGERDRRLAQSAADRARTPASASPRWAGLQEDERRRRQSQSDASRARASRWAGLPPDEQQRRQSQSDAARAAANRTRTSGAEAATVAELENDETLQAMGHTIEYGGYDFMSKDDW